MGESGGPGEAEPAADLEAEYGRKLTLLAQRIGEQRVERRTPKTRVAAPSAPPASSWTRRPRAAVVVLLAITVVLAGAASLLLVNVSVVVSRGPAAQEASMIALPTAERQAAASLSPAEVREVQSLLSAMALDPGPVDGIAGHKTIEAVKRFEQARGRSPSGTIDRDLLTALRQERASR